MKSKKSIYWIWVANLIILISSFSLGIFLKVIGVHDISTELSIVELIGKIWIIGFLTLSIPLICGYIIHGILTVLTSKSLGKIGAMSMGIHLIIMLGGTIFGVIYSFIVLDILGPRIPVIQDPAGIQLGASINGIVEYTLLHDALSIIRIIQTYLGASILYLLILAILFSFLVIKFAKSKIGYLGNKSLSLGTKSLNWIHKFLITMPLAIFCFVFPMAFKTGFSSIESMIYFVIFSSLLMLLFSILLFFVILRVGRLSLPGLARAIFPSAIFAISSRSSLATMPLMIDCSIKELHIPSSIATTIIPFYLSTFKMNMATSGPFQLLFFAFVFGVYISPVTLFIFIVSFFFMSLASPGIPSGTQSTDMPLYLSAGVPLEGILLLHAVDVIPDMFKTLINVMEVLAVTSLVAHFHLKGDSNHAVI